MQKQIHPANRRWLLKQQCTNRRIFLRRNRDENLSFMIFLPYELTLKVNVKVAGV